MVIVRCAWHRRYHGRARCLGIASWRGARVRFTDGICPECAVRVRAEFASLRRPASPPRSSPHQWAPAAVVVGLPLALGIVLAAAPTHEPPPVPRGSWEVAAGVIPRAVGPAAPAPATSTVRRSRARVEPPVASGTVTAAVTPQPPRRGGDRAVPPARESGRQARLQAP
jgi:hypothetical protein